MLRYLFTALGCLFWLTTLLGGARITSDDGLSGNTPYLIGIPVAMIAVTLMVSWGARRHARPGAVIAAGSFVALLAFAGWAGPAGFVA